MTSVWVKSTKKVLALYSLIFLTEPGPLRCSDYTAPGFRD
jgi:hypothetical protein